MSPQQVRWTHRRTELNRIKRYDKDSSVLRLECEVFELRSGGEHNVRGFTNRDTRQRFNELKALATKVQTVQRQSAKDYRLIHRLHVVRR